MSPALLGLPAELRNFIFELAIISPHPIRAGLSVRWESELAVSQTKVSPGQPALARVNRQLRDESLAIFYGQNAFLIDRGILNGHELRKWWRKFANEHAKKHLRHLVYRFSSPHTTGRQPEQQEIHLELDGPDSLQLKIEGEIALACLCNPIADLQAADNAAGGGAVIDGLLYVVEESVVPKMLGMLAELYYAQVLPDYRHWHPETVYPHQSPLHHVDTLPPRHASEIRNHIFELVLITQNSLSIGHNSRRDPQGKNIRPKALLQQPALARVNRQAREEALPVFYSQNTFLIDEADFGTSSDRHNCYFAFADETAQEYLKKLSYGHESDGYIVRYPTDSEPDSIEMTLDESKELRFEIREPCFLHWLKG
ncbi:hypothetical protein LTR42_010297 [Elasticomyces elasticus]|nr:hypothetical protein LTR42_010297 [Elasticomyces elasticus]